FVSAVRIISKGTHKLVKQTIIVLEDDVDIGNLVSHHLQQAGFMVRVCTAGDQVLPMARKQAPVLFLLDIMVPGGSGFEVCRQIRESRDLARIPIIFLTAKANEEDRVKGLDLGADDYITKPFGTRELTARVRAVLRRFEQPLTTSITTPDFELNGESMTLTVRGKPTDVTATEFRLLHFLASHPGRVYSRGQGLDALWCELFF